MTHRAVGSGHGVPRLWLLPITVLTVILGATAAGILSRSLVLDLVAWWPVWLGVLLIALLAHGRRVGRVRVSGLVPLIATAALALFLTGHLLGWSAMPSAVPSLVGPKANGYSNAALTAEIDGQLRVKAGSEFLYEVGAVRLGGEIGIPEATEQIESSSISVLLDPPPDPGFYAFAGWDIGLSSAPIWALVLEGTLDADLTGLQLTALRLTGDGVVTLGPADDAIPVSAVGDFQLIVGDGVAVRIVGEATVPESWQELTDGWKSPTGGDGWVISVPGESSLSVTDG